MSDVITFNTEEQSKPIAQPKPQTFSLRYGGPVEQTPEFDFGINGKYANAFASTLVETCKAHNGLSLSGPQCGYPHRVFVMGVDDEYVAFFNPKIATVSETTIKLPENSLTVPFLELKLKRPISVEVEYQDFNGEKHQSFIGGLSARIVQQQVNNLDGIAFYTLAKPLALEMAIKRQRKTLKRCGLKM